jgi:predicted branched-subunit amino acid permease
MLATFIGIVVPMLRNKPQVAAALVAGAVALGCHGLPYKLGLMVAALCGILVGVVLERRYRLDLIREDISCKPGA